MTQATYTTDQFLFDSKSRTLTAEASDLRLNEMPQTIEVRSSHTGKVASFRFVETVYAGEDVGYWYYRAPEQVVHLKIWND